MGETLIYFCNFEKGKHKYMCIYKYEWIDSKYVMLVSLNINRKQTSLKANNTIQIRKLQMERKHGLVTNKHLG